MRLKKIKLAGFKSFVDPTTIPFPDDMTAVVGPNGCGKSNVIDAVRWVLGESSAKNLRGDAMTDVIFNGSTARKPVSQCSVELVFDNSSGRIKGEYAGYNELSVKRIVTKDGQSNYLLNNSKCRRRDVTDLFLGTGLGPRSYAIIEQGMISRLIESKPQDLRVFIEEAAGVSKYKERRRETETRIRHSYENLERLEDVRGELAQQLEKLQAQATAAKRYTQLKQDERQYRAQLTSIRWLSQHHKIQDLDAQIAIKNTELEAYVAQQRSEEHQITGYKDQQQDLQQNQENLQQNVFKVSTEITGIEQNQLHSKQRRQQIEREAAALQDSLQVLGAQQQQNSQRLEELQKQIEVAEPEQHLLEEQFEQAQGGMTEAEEQFNHQQQKWRSQEQLFNQHKSQTQSCHGKIQSLMDIQMRTGQRIAELKDELNEVTDQHLATNIEQGHQSIAELEQQLQQCSEQVVANELEQQSAWQALQNNQQSEFSLQGQQQTLEAKLAALLSLQEGHGAGQTSEAFINTHQLDCRLWWQTLEIQPGWESAFETITSQWQQSLLVTNGHSNQAPKLTELVGATWLFEQGYQQNIDSDSIASKLYNTRVPSWLLNIKFCDNIEQGLAKLPQLSKDQSLITRDGFWLAQDWMRSGQADPQAGLLHRVSQIKALQNQQIQLSQSLDKAQLALKNTQQNSDQTTQKAQHSAAHQQLIKQQLLNTTNEVTLYEQQQQQFVARNTKVLQALARQQDIFEDEQQQLHLLSEQAEEFEFKLQQLQEQQTEVELNTEQQKHRVSQGRNQLDSIQTQLHRLALKVQELGSQHTSLEANQQRDLSLQQDMQQKVRLLADELQLLAQPLQDQQQRLQVLLTQRVNWDSGLSQIADKLAHIQQQLNDAQKGQQGVTDNIQARLTALQSLKLQHEGYKVRASAFLEQLQEMHQNLQQLLANLPEDAKEASWQNKVDKTLAAVSRLGPVNLAAVDEYNLQAQRKQHLDDQNDDLQSALDILQQAIRKIDNETRARFKQTFDQVNEDLKLLFPKVFGGGMAYLELTDNDLLETGVTIMARPPGKKNSTIHLLSGGEKALTALSLVFAIFRLNPAPFCLLDEVDAPLDDVNVGRFCQLVSEMSKTVQFIYITHNKIAMEMATHLTGVTMSEPGVSRMVAVDVEEALAIAKA